MIWFPSFHALTPLSLVLKSTHHPYLGHPSISQKNTQLNQCCFQYLWEKQNHSAKEFFCDLRDLRENRGQKRPLGQKVRIWSNKKKLIYQFFKTRICAFMTYGQFLPNSSSNLRFVIRYSRVRGPRLRPREGLESLNLRWQISNLSYF